MCPLKIYRSIYLIYESTNEPCSSRARNGWKLFS